MASIDFQKMKDRGTISAVIRHNDTWERTRHNHSNPDIDKSRTGDNSQWYELSYEAAIKKFTDRIKTLDETTNTNKRKDRVEAYALCIPIPAGVSDVVSASEDIKALLEEKYGKDNIIEGYLHLDEVHEYTEHGITKKSLPHIHILVVPEIDGKLAGKAFSSKSAMIEANAGLDSLLRDKHGCQFLTGDTAKKKTVEELKAEGAREKELISNLADKEPVKAKKRGLTDVTISKKDFQKLTDKAAAYQYISEGKAEGLEKLQADREKFQATVDKAAQEIQQGKQYEAATEELKAEYREAQIEIQAQTIKKKRLDDILSKSGGVLQLEEENAKLRAENQSLKEENGRLWQACRYFARKLVEIEKALNEYALHTFVPAILNKITHIKETAVKVLNGEETYNPDREHEEPER